MYAYRIVLYDKENVQMAARAAETLSVCKQNGAEATDTNVCLEAASILRISNT